MQTVRLRGDMALRHGAELVATLSSALLEGEAVLLDTSELLSIDAAVLQILLAAHRSAGEAGARLGLADPIHPVLRAALVRHGMIAADGSALTLEHEFWTSPIEPSEREAI